MSKTVIDVTNEERMRILKWAMKKCRFDMWNDKGVFRSAKAVEWIFRRGLEAVEKDME